MSRLVKTQIEVSQDGVAQHTNILGGLRMPPSN